MSFIDQPGFADDVRSVLTDLLGLPPALMDYIVQYNALNGLPIPISQITGFSQFTANSAVVTDSQTRTSSTYGDLATVGPTVSGLVNGHYVVIWSTAAAGNPSVSSAQMAISVNGSAAPGGDNGLAASTSVGSFTSIIAFDTFKLSSGDSNSLEAKYASSDNAFACSFAQRSLFALKFANL